MHEITTPTAFTLTPDQLEAKNAFLSGNSILLTGPAGTGKSTLVEQIKKDRRLSLCASTGIAALNIGGSTLHSWAGLGLGQSAAKTIITRLTANRPKAYDNILMCQRLVIDEISMIDARLLTLLEKVLRGVRRNDAPFGGIQLMLVGDFLQLPPVSKDREENLLRFAFHSPAWLAGGIKTHVLTTIVRQQDARFAGILNQIREGIVSPEAIEMLNERMSAPDLDPEIKPVILSSLNKRVDAYNDAKLAKMPGEPKLYEAADTGWPEQIEKLKNNCIAPTILALKPGTQVMLLKNLDTEGGLVNGSIGTVVKYDRFGAPIVDFNVGTAENKVIRTITVERALWEIKNDTQVLATRSQYPLRLAWAITIHKSQGMTLAKVRVDLSDVFEHGQAYVALSRVKTLAGLYLTGLNPAKITADPDALRFYREGPPKITALPQSELDL